MKNYTLISLETHLFFARIMKEHAWNFWKPAPETTCTVPEVLSGKIWNRVCEGNRSTRS